MPRASARLLELLVEHGVPERAGRLYLAACRTGPQTAAELARRAALHRVEAYRYLRSLQAAGLLTTSGRRPMRLVAVPPAELLDRWIAHASDRSRRLQEDRDRLLTEWEQEAVTADPEDARRFLVLEGRGPIQTFLKKRIGAAEREVLLTVSGFALPPAIDGGVDRALRQAADRGVRIRLVTEVTSANLGDAKHFASFTELRHAQSQVTNRSIIIDRTGALVFVSGEEGLGATGDAQVALWSRAPELLHRARQYHSRIWAHSVPAARRIVELESPPTAILSAVHGRLGEPFDRLREITELGMRAAGVRETQIDLPEVIETMARQLGRTIAPQVEGRNLPEVAHSLEAYYRQRALGKMEVVRERPMTLKVTGCFACLPQSPEIGRVLCPKLLQTVIEARLGAGWEVSRPEPRRHAARGCQFTVTPSVA